MSRDTLAGGGRLSFGLLVHSLLGVAYLLLLKTVRCVSVAIVYLLAEFFPGSLLYARSLFSSQDADSFLLPSAHCLVNGYTSYSVFSILDVVTPSPSTLTNVDLSGTIILVLFCREACVTSSCLRT